MCLFRIGLCLIKSHWYKCLWGIITYAMFLLCLPWKLHHSASWQIILDILEAFHLSEWFKKWIEVCITSPKFSLSNNGDSHGYFSGAKGLRRGSPFSFYFHFSRGVLLEGSCILISYLVSFIFFLMPSFGYYTFVLLMISSFYALLILHPCKSNSA